jgi:hypothetical protein
MGRQIFQYVFEVRCGVGFADQFPIDMLRYDGCSPARESEDSAPIQHRHHKFKPGDTIRLHKIWYKGWQPTDERWKSFGWEVVPDSLQAYPM